MTSSGVLTPQDHFIWWALGAALVLVWPLALGTLVRASS